LDGRNPNTYSNILWCFGSTIVPGPSGRSSEGPLHVLGGMESKTDVAAYVDRVNDGAMRRAGGSPCGGAGAALAKEERRRACTR